MTAADPAGRVAACPGRESRRSSTAARSPTALAVAAARGEIRERPVHNDAKIANVLFDDASGEALAVIDLDTTMPGLAAHDFGDLVRSSVSDSAEDEPDLGRVAVRLAGLRGARDGLPRGHGRRAQRGRARAARRRERA